MKRLYMVRQDGVDLEDGKLLKVQDDGTYSFTRGKVFRTTDKDVAHGACDAMVATGEACSVRKLVKLVGTRTPDVSGETPDA